MARHLERFGVDGILVNDPEARGDLLASALANITGVIEIVPGAQSVLLRFPDWSAARAARSAIEGADLPPPIPTGGAIIEIPVRYDGMDLPEVAAACGLTRNQVIDQHCSAVFTVAFCGFTPGFAYLAGLPTELRVPRLPSPRTHVPAGSVAIADAYCGIYPRATPGGWRIIGHSSAVLFDERRQPPALLTPGMRVTFVPGRA